MGTGRVLIAAVGQLATVPWLLLPCLQGRAVSVSSSVTTAIAGLSRHSGRPPARACWSWPVRTSPTRDKEAEQPSLRCTPAPPC